MSALNESNPSIIVNDLNQLRNDIPLYIKSIEFAYSFNQEITDEIPNHIEHIFFNELFDQSIQNTILPPNLKTLDFGGSKFNDFIDNFPNSLQTLELGFQFNKPIQQLPTNLKTLSIASGEDVIVLKHLKQLPDDLQELELSCRIEGDELKDCPALQDLPCSLETISCTLSFYCYHTKGNPSTFENLKHLIINDTHPTEPLPLLPKNLESICFGFDHCETFCTHELLFKFNDYICPWNPYKESIDSSLVIYYPSIVVNNRKILLDEPFEDYFSTLNFIDENGCFQSKRIFQCTFEECENFLLPGQNIKG